MKHIYTIVLLSLAASVAFSQSTTLKLPTATSASDFTVTDSSNNVLMKLFGDKGFYLNGTFGAGAIPIEGAGTRLLWYPKKAAFRAGYTDGNEWDDVNTGSYSTAFGWSCKASGDVSIAMGNRATASGNYSTAMGNLVSTSTYNGAFIIGDLSTASTTTSTANNQMTMRFDGGYRLFTKYDLSTGVSMGNGANSWSSISDSTKKTNFQPADGEYFLSSLSKLKLGSWNYKTQDPKQFRHYGPMAQEIFHYFGHDGIGTIGNDTTLATADMDGIIMICLQALEKKVREQMSVISSQRSEIKNQNEMIAELKARLEKLEATLARFADKKVASHEGQK